jgi:hypothetical protein
MTYAKRKALKKQSDYASMELPMPTERYFSKSGMLCLEFASPLATELAYHILVAKGVTPMRIVLGEDSEELTLVIPCDQLTSYAVSFGGHDASHTPAPVLTAV